MNLKERFEDRINEFFPFHPPAPLDELLTNGNQFIFNLLGEHLILIQHFGSTAITEQNVKREGYKKPHRGSDIDLAVVVSDSCDIQEISDRCRQALENSDLPKHLFQFLFVKETIYKNGYLYGHPSLVIWGHAKEYGRTIWQHPGITS